MALLVVVSNQNQPPYSHTAVCANSRTRYPVFHVLNYTYAWSRNLRPSLPPARAEAARATNHTAAVGSEYVRLPQVRWPLCVLVAIAGHLGEPLPPAPSTTPSPSSFSLCRCGMLASIRTSKRGPTSLWPSAAACVSRCCSCCRG